MRMLILPFSRRYITFTVAITAALVFFLLASSAWRLFWLPFGFAAALAALGVHDLAQSRHSILRSFPIAGNLRFLLEEIRPEIRQYFIESDIDGAPFNRDTRAIVYERAKAQPDKRPFGTELDVYATDYEWMTHSLAPAPIAAAPFRITIGGPDCLQPYSASVFNISAMSFGALSANAIRALNRGAKLGGFAPRHRGRRIQRPSSRIRRRHHLGDRQRLFRLPSR
jgi:glutamate synthase domain-containing protein 2